MDNIFIYDRDLWQWDINVYFEVNSIEDTDFVHFQKDGGEVLSLHPSNGRVIVPNQLLTTSGVLVAYAYVNEAENGKKTLVKQCFNVYERPQPPEYIADPTPVITYPELVELVANMRELEESVEEAETSRVVAETSRASNENTRQANESTRQANETARESAETERATAEAERESAETERASAEAQRQSNETQRELAETQRESATSQALEDIEEAIDEAENVDIDISKEGNVTTITITDRNGNVKSEKVLDTDIVANPEATGEEVSLERIKIGDNQFKIESGTQVEANPTATGEEGSLQRIKIDGVSYLLAADTTEFTEQEIQTIWNEVMQYEGTH